MIRAQELCVKVEVDVLGSFPVPNKPYSLCGRKATLNLNLNKRREQVNPRDAA